MRACDNPFRTEKLMQYRYQPLHETWIDLMDRLVTLDYRAAIVGPEGSGKTTLLEDLAPRLAALGFQTELLRLSEDGPTFENGFFKKLSQRLSQRHVVLLDGCEQLDWPHWIRFKSKTREARGLIVTSHNPGRLPTWIECETTPELLARIARSLLKDASSLEIESTAHQLFNKHNGNIREALLEWYDLIAV